MPPQQDQNLLDFGDGLFDFRTHIQFLVFAALRVADASHTINLALAFVEFPDCSIAFEAIQLIQKEHAVHLVDLILSYPRRKPLQSQHLVLAFCGIKADLNPNGPLDRHFNS
ncbi:MAG: hypothetical protein MO846_06485 [Candidatus Devosia symbiotica]|nr:hypothetical protein [Candidatus Devosia symbiotica]